MTQEIWLDRRTALKTAGAATFVIPFLAGCGSNADPEDGGGGDGSDGNDADSGGNDASGDSNDGSTGGEKPSFDGYMENVDNYDGVVDETGTDAVTVIVGSEANGGNFGFEPPVIQITTGTTVTWEWNGLGGQHNVVADNGDFESDLTDEEGYTFSQTFEDAGTTKYACSPHKTLGMKGVVIVE